MDKYSSSAGGDVETGLGPETVVLVGRKSSSGWMGKLLLAMLLVVLCAGGALLLLCYWDGRQQKQVRVPHLGPASSPGALSLTTVCFSLRMSRAVRRR